MDILIFFTVILLVFKIIGVRKYVLNRNESSIESDENLINQMDSGGNIFLGAMIVLCGFMLWYYLRSSISTHNQFMIFGGVFLSILSISDVFKEYRRIKRKERFKVRLKKIGLVFLSLEIVYLLVFSYLHFFR